jgi:hypothetical protein
MMITMMIYDDNKDDGDNGDDDGKMTKMLKRMTRMLEAKLMMMMKTTRCCIYR